MGIARSSLLLLCMLLWGSISHALHGPNVCTRHVVTQATRTTLRYYMCPVQKIRRSYVDTEPYTLSTPEQYCCAGYRQLQDRCEPTCPQGCTNGFCIAPGTCQCHPGYTRKSSTDCEPSCPTGCVNGRCTSPNTCTCAPGYQKPAGGNGNVCEPVCANGCQNGACTAPGVCTCKPGYEKGSTTPGNQSCRPKCTNGCANGVCTAPEQCTCNQLYVKEDGQCVHEPIEVATLAY